MKVLADNRVPTNSYVIDINISQSTNQSKENNYFGNQLNVNILFQMFSADLMVPAS